MKWEIIWRRVCAVLIWGIGLYFLLLISSYLVRIYFYDTFIIPSHSMVPTLIKGDYILLDKSIFGARIYDDLDSIGSRRPSTKRLGRERNIMRDDIVVFNNPYPYSPDRIEFQINNVFCKRVVGLPADTISIRNGVYFSSATKGSLGYLPSQQKISKIPAEHIQNLEAYPLDDKYKWTIKEFGPFYIPKLGESIVLDSNSYILYEKLIEYETGKQITIDGQGLVLLGGRVVDKYTFASNYYFVVGDNALNSCDSRNFGVVPESHIVGVVRRILFSNDKLAWKWGRTMKIL